MKLPYLENAFVPEAKLTKYLLNIEHVTGKDKAAFFLRFGFSIESWEVMASALIRHAQRHEVVSVLETPQGIHYAIQGELISPDGRNPHVKTIWALDTDSNAPRFITAYPVKPKG